MVVRIVVALQEHDLARDLREIEVGLVASGLRPAVLAVVHEVADMDEQIVRLAALVDPANQRSIVFGHALERTVRPVDDPRILGALEVQIAGKECLHCLDSVVGIVMRVALHLENEIVNNCSAIVCSTI